MTYSFTRAYSNVRYRDAVTVNHAGRLIGLAGDESGAIWYAVLDPTNRADAEGWPDQPRRLPFPDELAFAGFGVADQIRMPIHRRGNSLAATRDDVVAPDERDTVLSTTARLGAAAPFQVVSDGRHLVVFRQSISATDPADGARQVSATVAGAEVRDSDGEPVRVVDSVILMDRYLLVDDELHLPREVRYQRSRSRTRPASAKDGLGSADLEGAPFVEPTSALRFVGQVHQGAFTVLLTPTAVAERQRWNVVLVNDATGMVDIVSCERSREGQASTMATLFYTCREHDEVFTTTGGTCPAESAVTPGLRCGLDLVPRVEAADAAGSALRFGADGDHVALGAASPEGTDVTAEIWFRSASDHVAGSRTLLGDSPLQQGGRLRLDVVDGERLAVSIGVRGLSFDTTTDAVLSPGWHHVAVTFDGVHVLAYVDGTLGHVSERLAASGSGTAYLPRPGRIGMPENGFRGDVDEVRLWSRCRTGREIRQQLSSRLTGLEPDLVGYWRLDEARGERAHDSATNGSSPASVVGARWVSSTAPVGDEGGVRRSTFSLRGRSVTTTISARLYHRQESSTGGYGATTAPVKTAARMLLAFGSTAATEGWATTDEVDELTVLDIGLARDGTAARLPAALVVPRETPGQPSATPTAPAPAEAPVEGSTAGLPSATESAAVAEELSLASRAVTHLRAARATLARTSESMRVVLHERWDYDASRKVSLGPGQFRMTDFPDGAGRLMVNGVSSLQIPSGLEVACYHGANWDGGDPLILSASCPRLPAGWNDAVGSVRISIEAGLLEPIDSGLAAAEARLTTAREDFNRVSRAANEPYGTGTEPVSELLTSLARTEAGVAAHEEGVDALTRRSEVLTATQSFVTEVLTTAGRSEVSAAFGVSAKALAARDRLRAAVQALDGATAARQEFTRQASLLRVVLHERWDYDARGKVGLGLGQFRMTDFPDGRGSLMVNGVSSLQIPSGLEVACYHGANWDGGDPLVLSGSCPRLPAGWNDAVGSWRVSVERGALGGYDARVTSAEARQVAEVADLQELARQVDDERTALVVDLAAARGRLADARQEVSRLRERLSGQTSVAMPFVAMDVRGLTATGCVMAGVRTSGRPTIVESATGRVCLYHRDDHGDFRVAYFDVRADRATFTLAASGAAVVVQPKSADLHAPPAGRQTTPARLTVELSSESSSPDTCTAVFTLTAGADLSITETWEHAPRDATAFAALIAGLAGDHAQVRATTTNAAADLGRGSQLVTVVAPPSAGDLVVDQAPSAVAPDVGCRWFADAAGSALEFTGSGSSAGALDSDVAGFATDGTTTVEAWVLPRDRGLDGTIASARLPRADGHETSWSLGVRPLDPEAVSIAFEGEHDWLELHPTVSGPLTAFTAECWVRPTRLSGQQAVLASATTAGGPEWALRIVGDIYQFVFLAPDDDQGPATAAHPDDLDAWVHLACRWDGHRMSLLRNGVLEATLDAQPVAPPPDDAPVSLCVGAAARGGADHLAGCVDAIRLHASALSDAQLAASAASHTAGSHPTETDHDLVGEWTFRRGLGSTPESPGAVPHGRPKAGTTARPNLVVSATAGLTALAAVDPVVTHEWVHLALSLREGRALRLDGTGVVDCSTSSVLDIDGDLTIEVGVQLDDLGDAHPLVQRGSLTATDGEGCPYAFGVDTDGCLVFQFVTVEQQPSRRWVSRPVFTSPGFHRVGVTRSVTTTSPTDKDSPVVRSLSVRFFVDGEPVDGGSGYVLGKGSAEASRSSAPTLLGAASPTTRAGRPSPGLRGHLGEVRIWNVARADGQLGIDVSGHVTGLAGRWRPEAGTGAVLEDSAGTNHGRLRGAIRWEPTPDPHGDRVVLLVDGTPVDVRPEAADPPAGVPHFILGSTLSGSRSLDGRLDEVRVWRTVRTTEQVQDLMFRRPWGNQPDLVARYAFAPQGDGLVCDSGPLHNALTRTADLVVSTAPLSEDAPQVGNALVHVPTRRVVRIDGTPGAAEYADLQLDADGEAVGVLKRCYTYTADGAWNLVSGFKVGDLVTEWLGQIQYKPQLKGYIEGAPPVPSENLTHEDDYRGASTVTLTDAASTTLTYTSSVDEGSARIESLSASAGLRLNTTAGFGVFETLASANVLGGRAQSWDTDTGTQREGTRSQGHVRTQVSSMSLRGRKETSPAHPAVGQRWVPDNVGYALVQSETADLYALRLGATGPMVSYQVLPNPDIPKDWNVITFRINPAYVKQGVLDGRVGVDTDASYPQANGYGNDLSYFKPAEAYALKNGIERDRQRERAHYDQFAAESLGRSGSQPRTLDAPTARDIVNTYVWTADGGLFSEEVQGTEGRSERTAGSFTRVTEDSNTFLADVSIAFAATQIEYSAGARAHFDLNVSKAHDSSTSFGVAVTVDPESNLAGPGDETGIPDGKVDAYRFMTFYLDPRPSHHDVFFHSVVDPAFLLEGSAAAVALAEARQDASQPACWRVLHRVTYVSRRHHDIGAAEATGSPLAQALVDIDVESNYELIKLLDPFVRPRATDRASLRSAVTTVIEQRLPVLRTHVDEIIDYLARYYGVPGGGGVGEDPIAGPTAGRADRPVVDLPLEVAATLPAAATLAAAVHHDERAADAFVVAWSLTDGPGPVTFEPSVGRQTTVSAAQAGVYRLRATVTSPGCAPAAAETTLVLRPAPRVQPPALVPPAMPTTPPPTKTAPAKAAPPAKKVAPAKAAPPAKKVAPARAAPPATKARSARAASPRPPATG